MDEDKKEATTTADKVTEEEAAATTKKADEVVSTTTTVTTTIGDPAAAPESAAEEAPASPKKEKDNDKPSEKEDVKMEDADGTQSANGGGGKADDGNSKEAEAEAEATPKAEKADDAKTKDEPAADTTPDPAAKSGGKSSSRKKRAAPASPAPAAAAVSSPSPAPAESGGREKRARKALVAYAPDDFTKIDRSVQILPGRGKKVGSLKAVRASVEASKDHALAELAHKLLYGGNKYPAKDAIKGNILEFSGYLPPKLKGVTEKELEAMDKKLEAKMGEKAFNLKVGEIRDLCDFFALDRSGINAKAELIDRLLDFLSEPSAEHVKGNKAAAAKASSASKKKGVSSKKKKDDSSEESDEEEEENEEEEEEEAKPKKGKKDKEGVDLLKVEKGKVPNDDTIRAWVKCFVQCYDLEKASIKVALQVAGDKFGVDLSNKKDLLKEMLADAMG